MAKEVVEETWHRQPFQPLSIRLTDGKLVPVPHPEFLAVAPEGNTMIVFGPQRKFFNPGHQSCHRD